MKKLYSIMAMAAMAISATVFTGCSSDDDESLLHAIVDFENVPTQLMASDKYGQNLYSQSNNQVTTGYLAQIGNTNTYVQFPINYNKQEWEEGTPWRYEYFNGGIAISHFNDMTGDSYQNQCSVYHAEQGHSGSNFAVANGFVIVNKNNPAQTTYEKCAKIYLTDKKGYGINESNPQSPVIGTAKYGTFQSVWVCNTTYTYLTMKNGVNTKPLADQKGWFKMIFIALDEEGKATGKQVEYYLANFDNSKNAEAGLTNNIRTGWNQVDLRGLGNNVCTIAINFEGSDANEWGLVTPAYVALDDLEVTVNQ